jgi:hypothetical protein
MEEAADAEERGAWRKRLFYYLDWLFQKDASAGAEFAGLQARPLSPGVPTGLPPGARSLAQVSGPCTALLLCRQRQLSSSHAAQGLPQVQERVGEDAGQTSVSRCAGSCVHG